MRMYGRNPNLPPGGQIVVLGYLGTLPHLQALHPRVARGID